MTNYSVRLGEDAVEFLHTLDEKSRRICKDNLRKLEANPYPGRGKGDTERLPVDGEGIYRLHIGRTYTAFYIVLEDEREVRVVEILPIDDAHKRYG